MTTEVNERVPSLPPSVAPLVGRAEELAILHGIVGRAVGSGAHIVLVEGSPGVGKTALLRSLAQQCTERGGPRFAFAQCYGETSTQSAYHPFLELLTDISEKRNASTGWSRVWKFIGETAPDWLQLIPAVGPAIGAGVKSIHVATEMVADAQARGTELERQFIATVEKLAAAGPLPVIVIEDVHLIDAASCALLNKLSGLQDATVTLLLTYRSTDVEDGHPLRRLMLDWVSRKRATRIALRDLGERDIATYLGARYGYVPHALLQRWLSQLCSGNPLYVVQYLNLLEEAGVLAKNSEGRFELQGGLQESRGLLEAVGPLRAVGSPESVEALLEERIQRLLENERELLQLGSVQGERFFSLVLAELTQKRERDILFELRRVSERHRLIRTQASSDWYKDKSEAYVFEHVLMQRAFYRRLSRRERSIYHSEVAEILQKVFSDRGREVRQVSIEIAFHLSAGDQPEAAAMRYYQAARSSFDDGAFAEVEQLCESALAQLLKLSESGQASAQLFAETVLLLLTSGSHRADDEVSTRRYLALARTARAATQQIGLRELSVRLAALEGSLLIPLGRTEEGIKSHREAVDLSKQGCDEVTQFFALVKLGENLAKENVKESVDVREAALELFNRTLAERPVPALRRLHAGLLVYLGVGYLDIGNLGKAGAHLQQGIEALKQSGQRDHLLQALNYFAQYFVAVGSLDEAAETLAQADALNDVSFSGSAWYAYNQSLLGRIRLEQGSVELAGRLLCSSLERSEAANAADLVTLVRVYAAELFMHPTYSARDTQLSEKLLIRNLVEAKQAGLRRSQVLSLCALADLRFLDGDLRAALDFTTEAVAALNQWGPMPAVRSEEVLFKHYGALRHAGQSDEARAALAQAWEIMNGKAATLEDEATRALFLTNVELNRAIADAWANTVSGDTNSVSG